MLEFVSPIEIFFKKKNHLRNVVPQFFVVIWSFKKMLIVGFLVCFVFQKLHCENMW